MSDPHLRPGPLDAITDVAGVRVGHVTLVEGDGRLVRGGGPVRTGVTAIIPGEDCYARKFAAGAHVINGFGKMTGLPQVVELGRLETPVVLTNTLSTWTAADALAAWLGERHPEIGVTAPTVNPVVGECNDGWLNDIQGRHVRAEHVRAALEGAVGGPVPEGAVGAGTGMVCYGFKGGIGTASRVWEAAELARGGTEVAAGTGGVDGGATGLAGEGVADAAGGVHAGGAAPAGEGHATGVRVTLGCLVLANFGRRGDLRIDGVPVEPGGRALPAAGADRGNGGGVGPGEGGSVVVILATDAPLTSRQLTRVTRRAEAGLARTGTAHWHGSGDFVLAFSTARAYPPYLPDEGPYLNPFFEAAADVVHDSVARALLAARTMTGRDGHVAVSLLDALGAGREAAGTVPEATEAQGGTTRAPGTASPAGTRTAGLDAPPPGALARLRREHRARQR